MAWGEDIDESKLPDDDQIACAQAKQLIMRGPPSLTPTSGNKINIQLPKDTIETIENAASIEVVHLYLISSPHLMPQIINSSHFITSHLKIMKNYIGRIVY